MTLVYILLVIIIIMVGGLYFNHTIPHNNTLLAYIREVQMTLSTKASYTYVEKLEKKLDKILAQLEKETK